MANQITCPACHHQFDVDEVLSREAELKLTEKLTLELTSQFEAKQAAAKDKWQAALKKELAEQQQAELELLTTQLKSRDDQLKDARATQLKLLQEKDQFAQEKQAWELENQKKMMAAREEITAAISKKITEEQQLLLAEKDKKIADYEKEVLAMKRKIDQGSQQLQGEVLELLLEDQLRQEFAADLIEAIGKGVNGADVRQKVVNKNGQVCGTIIWESKRTKNWTEGWVAKLKEDQRQEKANLAILVTTALPKDDHNSLRFYQGIWICEPAMTLTLATLLRFNLVRVHQVLTSQENKDEKLESLYRFLTGPEFVQRIEALMETYQVMREDLEKERRVLTKRLSERETQLNKLVEHTASLYGGLQGVTNNALPTVKLLELE